MELELGLRINRNGRDATKFVETDTTFLLIIYLSGVEKEQIYIEINDQGAQISIGRRGGRSFCENLSLGSVSLESKLKFGQFHRTFWLPDGVVVDQIRATFDERQEILYVYMPKSVKGRTGHGIEEVEEHAEVEDVNGGPEEVSPDGGMEASDEECELAKDTETTPDRGSSDSEFEVLDESNNGGSDEELPEEDETEEAPRNQETIAPEQLIVNDIEIEVTSEDENEVQPPEFDEQFPEDYLNVDIHLEEDEKKEITLGENADEKNLEEQETAPDKIQEEHVPPKEVQSDEISPDKNIEKKYIDEEEEIPREVQKEQDQEELQKENATNDDDENETAGAGRHCLEEKQGKDISSEKNLQEEARDPQEHDNITTNDDHKEETRGPEQPDGTPSNYHHEETEDDKEQPDDNVSSNDREEEIQGVQRDKGAQDKGKKEYNEEKDPERREEPETSERHEPELFTRVAKETAEKEDQIYDKEVVKEPRLEEQVGNANQEENPGTRVPELHQNEKIVLDVELPPDGSLHGGQKNRKEIVSPTDKDRDEPHQSEQLQENEPSITIPEDDFPSPIKNDEYDKPHKIASPLDVDRDKPVKSTPEYILPQPAGSSASRVQETTSDVIPNGKTQETPDEIGSSTGDDREEYPEYAKTNGNDAWTSKPEEEEQQSKAVQNSLPQPTKPEDGARTTDPNADGAPKAVRPATARKIDQASEEEEVGDSAEGGKTKAGGGGGGGGIGGRRRFPQLPSFPLSSSAMWMGSTFVLSLAVLMLHLMKEKKRQ